ncbi:hypothetical protein BCR33DRAFT_724291 [Rhizoclosmatium globosum]|uniref:Uncharacterized protein n=1 Tax=Rhizoclosmatium globosum TaxID=329046 RepID=A0A1Y2B6J6_9FUNG|nr:hypothetical protein BCR33DRAFT_724291 [Rhizoclosmatium globosum]|eukprot:ORY30462.1 hypothetical protein BCR33DRAFT_724291 [Rhizoclosmatium globosum]
MSQCTHGGFRGRLRRAGPSPLPPIPSKTNNDQLDPSISELHSDRHANTDTAINNQISNNVAENTSTVSLRVCRCCQDQLMSVFDHCLSKTSDDPEHRLSSFHEIDEVADAQILTNPPLYQMVKDPTKRANAIFDETIEEKDREIRQLREKLYDKSISEKMEQENVKHLKVPKSEMSSLMAFLINSEEEKRMMLLEMQEIRNVSKAKDDERTQIEYQREEYKAKLQEAYKEYLATNEIITKLRKEAEHGSDVIISRNEVLQRNIDKISRDFEITAKELAAANLRIKDLQFELDEMVLQFNITGQGQRTAEELNVKLTSELTQLKNTYDELKHLQTETAMRVVNLETDVRNLQSLLELTKSELESQAADLRKELELVTEALKSLTRSKDQVKPHSVSHPQENPGSKEQLLFQVTDLQNNLDRELSNVNILSFELSQLKRTSEEKIFNWRSFNLANDKRVLTEKLRQFDKLTVEFTDFKGASAGTEASLQHDTLTSEHKTLNQKQAALIEANLELIVEREALKKQVISLEEQNLASKTEIGMLMFKNNDLTAELEESSIARNEMKIHLDSVLGKLQETTSILNQERYESSNVIKEKTEQIIKMSSDLYKVTEDRHAQVARLEIELSDTKAALAAETFNKEQFEVHLYELRRHLIKELEKLSAMRARDRKMMEVSKQLHSEYTRLQIIEGMLPDSSDLQTTESPDIPHFHPDGKPPKPKHKRDTKSPEMRVTVTKREQ